MAVVNTSVSGSTYPMVPRNWIYESSQFGMTSDALSENILVVRPVKETYDSRSPGNLIQIKVDNPTCFWRPQRSFLSFRVRFYGADGSIQNNTVGGMSVIKGLTVKLGGKVVDSLDDYVELLSQTYQFETTGRKKYLRHFEGYGRTDFFNTTNEGTVVRHHLQLGSLNPLNGQPIPLCLLTGNSCEISLSLNSPTYALQNAANAYFVIDEVRYVCEVVGPSSEFLAAAHAGIQKGHYLEMDYVQATQIISPLSGSSMNTIILPLTNSRVVGLSHRFRNDDSYATTTGNKERVYNDAGLLSYRYTLGGWRLPLQEDFTREDAVMSGALSMSNSSMYESEDLDFTTFDDQQFTIRHSFASKDEEIMGSSLNLIGTDGNLRVVLHHDPANVPSTRVSMITTVYTVRTLMFGLTTSII
ncbi:hypothetical protein BC832DRAFT_591983 [Gaertneriomyces semiglobifer]|nr:hypothetical protein BC832DRAFT_591983 [Gaertneriomyces semiglobifer]